MKKIFINAPVFLIENNNIPVYQIIQREIHETNNQCIAPPLSLHKIDPNNMAKYMRSCTKLLLESDIMVTHGNWYDHMECARLIDIARLLEIPVIHHSVLQKFLKEIK